jgi:hypothetical protein
MFYPAWLTPVNDATRVMSAFKEVGESRRCGPTNPNGWVTPTILGVRYAGPKAVHRATVNNSTTWAA